jgi:DNA invertase Pin-like site-specific DNA recombinase
VTHVDRLARFTHELQNIIWDLNKTGVTLSATKRPIDTKRSDGKIFHGYGVNFKGVWDKPSRSSNERGVYKSRKPSVDAEKVKALKENGLGTSAIAKEMGIGRASIYPALGS